MDDVGKRKFLTLQGPELRPLCRPAVASRYTDCAIPAPHLKPIMILHLLRSSFFLFGGVGLNPPLGPFAGPLGSYKPQYCGHMLAYCTFSPDDIYA
jgi:hypothetical protein